MRFNPGGVGCLIAPGFNPRLRYNSIKRATGKSR